MRKALRFDRTQYLEQFGHEVMSADPRSYAGVQEEYHATSTLPQVKNAANEVVSTFGEWSEVWQQQFEEQEV